MSRQQGAPVVLIEPQVPDELKRVAAAAAEQIKLEQIRERIKVAQNNAQLWVSQAKSSPQVSKLMNSLDKLDTQVKQQYSSTVAALQQPGPLIQELSQKLNENVKRTGNGIQRSLQSIDLPQIRAPSAVMVDGQLQRVSFAFGRNSLDDDIGKVDSATGEVGSKPDIVGAQLLEQSRLALQQCQEQLKMTASNCQDNLAQLGQQVKNTLQKQQDGKQINLQLPFNLSNNLQQLLGGEKMSSQELLDYLASEQRGPLQAEADRRRRRIRRSKHSSLEEAGRHISIFTTAALPWMTGTSVNPLLRAAFLANDETSDRKVTLLIPWLAPKDQVVVYPKGQHFDSPEEQEQYVRRWVEHRTGFPAKFSIRWYPGRFAPEKGSILPVGDITAWVPDHEADVAVLEEPEHLTWYHHGRRFTEKFPHVVGVMHTNYLDYVRREEDGENKENVLRKVNEWVTRIHCHKVIKLSDAVQKLPREETRFVHGVSPMFLSVGDEMRGAIEEGNRPFDKGAYFIAKVVWGKGYTELLDVVEAAEKSHGTHLPMDVYGYGDDYTEVVASARERQLPLSFQGGRDHLDHSLRGYRVFVNPSLSDVVATTTAEALAMGKWVVCAKHPSNDFFAANFSNCLTYDNSAEFAEKLHFAMSNDPTPLQPDQRKLLTWEDATARFVRQASIGAEHQPQLLDNMLHFAHNTLTGIEPLRVAAGAGMNTLETPQRVVDFEPTWGSVGFMDDTSRIARVQGK